eukprot:1161810-Pelagomonas_calceolata.AAC.19
MSGVRILQQKKKRKGFLPLPPHQSRQVLQGIPTAWRHVCDLGVPCERACKQGVRHHVSNQSQGCLHSTHKAPQNALVLKGACRYREGMQPWNFMRAVICISTHSPKALELHHSLKGSCARASQHQSTHSLKLWNTARAEVDLLSQRCKMSSPCKHERGPCKLPRNARQVHIASLQRALRLASPQPQRPAARSGSKRCNDTIIMIVMTAQDAVTVIPVQDAVGIVQDAAIMMPTHVYTPGAPSLRQEGAGQWKLWHHCALCPPLPSGQVQCLYQSCASYCQRGYHASLS